MKRSRKERRGKGYERKRKGREIKEG